MTDYSDTALPAEETTLPEPDHANVGAPRPPMAEPDHLEVEADGMPPEEVLHRAMRAVVDPEIGYNVVDLGLVYGVEKRENGHVQVTMTLTTMGCPLTELIHQQVSIILGALPGVRSVDVDFTFSPPWTPEMIADDVKEELRAMGMNV